MIRWTPTTPAPAPQRWQSRAEILKAHLDSLTRDELLRVRPDYYPLRFGYLSLESDDARKALHPPHYNPDQPRVPAGNSDGGQWTTVGGVWAQYAQLGSNNGVQDPAIERTRQALYDTLIQVNRSVASRNDPLSARIYGIAVHTEFANAVRSLNLPGIGVVGVEQSFDWDGLKRYGFDGSIRTDVVLRNEHDEIIAIFDVKTGNATMRPARESRIRAFTRVGRDVPLIILHAVRGSGPR